jgi:hypothetical protein
MHNENATLWSAAIVDTRNQAYDAAMENDQRRHHRLCRPSRASLGPILVNLTGPSILADHRTPVVRTARRTVRRDTL